MGLKYEEVFEVWERAVAKGMVARFLAKWTCLAQEDFDSLVGKCLVQWLIAKPTYKPSRGATEKTYMATVVHNRLMDLVRERSTLKSKMLSEAMSLHEPRSDETEDDLTLLETIDSSTVPGAPRDPLTTRLLKGDVSRVLPSLTERQRKLCGLLEAGKTKTEAGEVLGISRDTVHEEIKRIRKLFEKAGLAIYRK